MAQHGGRREGAGRPKGSLNRRSQEAVDSVTERFPGWSPLMHLAAVANDETQPAEIRLDAAKAAAPYFHAKLKPVEHDPEAAVAFEERLAKAKAQAADRVDQDVESRAERLRRARLRVDAMRSSRANRDAGVLDRSGEFN